MVDNTLNAVNRGVYISDNLPFLQSLNDRCVDLVCIDPPFAKNETFGRKNSKSPDPLNPPLSDEEKATEMELLQRWGIHNEQEATKEGIDWPETRYKDFWSWEKDIQEEWMQQIADYHPGVNAVIEATKLVHGNATAAYLCYMAVRLFEMRRILKDTGSLYLHCDHTAGAYLRQLLDAILGNGSSGTPGFRNEIAWRRYGSHNDAARKYGQVRDSILFYVKSKSHFWRDIREDLDEEYVKNTYRNQDARGKYRTAPLHTGGLQGAGYEYEFRGYLRTWRYPEHRMQELENDDRIRQGRGGQGVPERKVYLNETKGKPLSDWWQDINSLTGQNRERTGYPTQKPVRLAERIIEASCPEGGVVLDCFAGCAYVAVAAERLGRDWFACDINPRAWTIFKRQFSKPKLGALLTCAEPMPTDNVQKNLFGSVATVHGPKELPTITIRAEDTPAQLTLPKPIGYKRKASIIPAERMLAFLLDLSDFTAWCCGFANRKPDGSVVRTTNNFHLDHLDPKSKDGSDQIFNRAPLCPHHNIHKNTRRVHLDDYRKEISKANELLVNSVADLVNLAWARDQVMDFWAEERMKHGIQHDLTGRT